MGQGVAGGTRPGNVRLTTFGPSALVTPANGVTVVRLLSAPLLLALILARGPSWVALGVWVVLAGTDGLDGWIARRHGTTRSGAFLDPLADKFLLLAGLVGLAVKAVVGWVPVGLIAGRELAMSAYRVSEGRRGVSIPARRSAKLKTLCQDLAVALALAPPVASDHHLAISVTLWVAVGLTLGTGLQYLLDARRVGRASPVSGR
jgi:CDP-diacylglycerol--glycerol-3-phosphate 3-phosphatidyltransferase